MKKKIKRISKMVMTIVLTATMLFGQLPSGLVLVANADTISGNGNSTLPDMSAGAAKYFNPDNGGGQIGDPKSLPDEEETSEEEGSEEDESESSSIEEESDSSKEKVEANSEKEIQSEEKTSEEKISEEKTSEEKTSESAKQDVKDASNENEEVGDGDDSAPNPVKIDAPTEEQIKYKDEFKKSRDYDESNDVSDFFEINKDLYDNWKNVTLTATVSESNANEYSTVHFKFVCSEGFSFTNVNPDNFDKECNFTITKKKIKLNTVTISGSKEYDANTTLPSNCSIEYEFEGGYTVTEVNPSGDTYELESADVPVPPNKAIVKGNFTNLISDNYEIDSDQTDVDSDVTITPLKVSLVFSKEVSKDSDATTALPNTVGVNDFKLKNGEKDAPGGVSVRCNDLKKLTYNCELPAIPAKNISINATLEDFEIEKGGVDKKNNYDINFDSLLADINPVDAGGYIDLANNSSTATDKFKVKDKQISFTPQNVSLNNDNKYWFGSEQIEESETNVVLKLAPGANFYVADGEGNYAISDGGLALVEQGFSKKLSDSYDYYIEIEGVFYSGVIIGYNYDITAPTFNGTVINDELNDGSVNDECSGIFKYGFVNNENERSEEHKKTAESWVYVQDIAGNESWTELDSKVLKDKTVPKITEIVTTPVSSATTYNGKDYLDSVSFNVFASDVANDEDDKYVSGLGEIKVVLLDGASNPVQYGEPILYQHPDYQNNQYKHHDNDVFNCPVSIGSSQYGYQLHFLISVTDMNHNTRYYRAHYSSGTKKVEYEEIASNLIESGVSLENTFAVLGANDKKPMLTINYKDDEDDSKVTYIGEDGGIKYYNGTLRKASVDFSKMAVNHISFATGSIGEGNQSSFDASSYDSSVEHCYIFTNGNWSFAGGENVYEIQLENSIPNYEEEETDPELINLKNIITYQEDSTFSIGNSAPKVNISIPESSYKRNHTYVGKEITKETYYFSEATTATITVSGDNLYNPRKSKEENENDFNDPYTELVKIVTCTDGGNNVTLDTNHWKKWTWDEINNYFKAEITFDKDGECVLEVSAKSRTSSEPENPSKELFIIDTVEPRFSISYSKETNTVEGEERNYYYGLENGTGGVTNVVAEINIAESNLFKNDILLFVSKNGEDYLPLTFGDNVDNPYEIKVDVDGVSEDQPNTSNNSGIIKISLPGKADNSNDGRYIFKVEYADPVNQKMIKAIETDACVIKDGVYSGTEHVNIIDTKRPEATFSIIDASGDNNIGRHYDNDGDYYNFSFKGFFAVEDNNFYDNYMDIGVNNSKDFSGTIIIGKSKFTLDEEKNTYSYSIPNPADGVNEGNYYFGIRGKDKAGNVLIVKAGTSATNNDFEEESENKLKDKKLDTAEEYYVSGMKVYDVTNPEVELVITTSADKTDVQEYSDKDISVKRFFFNNSFTAKFNITEQNFHNEEDVEVYYGVNNTAKDNIKDSVSIDKNNKINVPSGVEGKYSSEEKTFDEEGLYILSLSGTDKAGNPVKLSDSGIKKNNIEKVNNNGEVVSYVFVIDKNAPVLSVTMDDFYKYKLSKVDGKDSYSYDGANQPYQKKDKATITFKETTDYSPSSITYSISSTIKDGNISVKDAPPEKNFEKTVVMEGKQVYRIDSISVVDMAGNKVEMTTQANKIYLDVTPPSNDQLAPRVNFVAKASGAGRGPQGNELYTGEVKVQANIVDNPGENNAKLGDKDIKISSSGIYKIYYKVLVKENDTYVNRTEGNGISVDIGNKEKGQSGFEGEGENRKGYISYNTGGSGYDNKDSRPDEDITYNDTLIFTIPANATYNFNDIYLRVWTEDNAGNAIPENNAAFYRFGIDTTPPSITVNYNNNDAQNGKYFKDPRTATVAVKERNFDAGRIHISTESGAHVSGWSYSKGNPNGNGDDDTWTATVVYDTDGDYTFGVSGSDLVNHGASVTLNGVAPTEFTIDLTKPVITVAFDNNRVANGRYYNANRRATIDITEHNFDAKDATVERTAAIAEGTVAVPGIGNWARINDINRNEVYFGQDGDYTMKVDYVDLAGNIAETYVVDLFTIDTVAPELEIGGVEDKHAYNGRVAPSITYHDINYDKNSANIGIVGNKHKGDNSLDGNRTDERFGGSFVCNNIQEVRDNDDIYTAKASISDLAGNTTEKQVTFSVNRFGSTYIISDGTQKFLDKYYNQQGETLEITEINVNELASYGVTYSVDGNTSHNIVEGEEFTVQQAHDGDGWWEYNYRISGPKNFTDEGNYLVELKSRDGAANDNGNRFIQKTVSETYELPIEFVIDHSAPTLIMTGVEEGGRYRADERTVMIRYDDSISFLKSLKVYEGDKLVQEYDQKQLSEAGGEIQYQAKASNRKQEIRLEAVDMAGNQGKLSSGEFLLTSSAFIQFINNTVLLIAVIAGLIVLVGGIIFLVAMLNRRKRY